MILIDASSSNIMPNISYTFFFVPIYPFFSRYFYPSISFCFGTKRHSVLCYNTRIIVSTIRLRSNCKESISVCVGHCFYQLQTNFFILFIGCIEPIHFILFWLRVQKNEQISFCLLVIIRRNTCRKDELTLTESNSSEKTATTKQKDARIEEAMERC